MSIVAPPLRQVPIGVGRQSAPAPAPDADRLHVDRLLMDRATADDFKAVMNRWCSGVTVITGRDGERAHGMVASSFTSVSIDPITVLFCANHSTRTYALIKAAGAFAVNILAEDQLETFRVFAGQKGDPEDRFAGEEIATAVSGAPVLARSLAWLDCLLVAEYPGGNTHSIFVGEVLAAGTSSAELPPLTYFARHAHRLGDSLG